MVPPNSGEILAILLAACWSIVSGPAYVNLHFRQVFSTMDILDRYFRLLGITFCSGLYEVLTASIPPGAEWFEPLLDEFPSGL